MAVKDKKKSRATLTTDPAEVGGIVPNSKEVMIDIETLGVEGDSVVLSIAAITFDRTDVLRHPGLSILVETQTITVNEYISSFHSPVSLLDCLAAGCQINKPTAEWWKKQKDRTQLVESMAYTESLHTTMTRLKTYLETGYDLIWAKSPTFDLTILRSLAKSVGVDLGIDFRKERDVRTEIQDYPQFDVREISKYLTVHNSLGTGISLHNPVYDSVIQIQAIQEVYAAKFTPVVLVSRKAAR